MNAVATLLEREQHYLHISASAVRTLEACPRQFFLKYVEGIPAQDFSPRMLLGVAVHSALADYYRRLRDGEAAATLNELVDVASASIRRMEHGQVPVAYGPDENGQTLMETATRVLQAFLDQGLHPSQVIAVEKAWSLRMDGYDEIVVGAFDLVYRADNGRLVVVDHKVTGRFDRSKSERGDIQMGLYAHAARELFGVDEVELRYQDLLTTKKARVEVQVVQRQRDDEAQVLEAVQGALEMIGVAVSHPRGKLLMGRRRSWMCKSCGWRRHCSQTQTKGF